MNTTPEDTESWAAEREPSRYLNTQPIVWDRHPAATAIEQRVHAGWSQADDIRAAVNAGLDMVRTQRCLGVCRGTCCPHPDVCALAGAPAEESTEVENEEQPMQHSRMEGWALVWVLVASASFVAWLIGLAGSQWPL